MTGGNHFGAFAVDGLSENGSGGGAIACVVVGFRSDFANHLGAHVFELVREFDFFSDRDTVFGDVWSAEGFFDHNVAAFRTEGDFNSVSEDVDAVQDCRTSIFRET